MMQPFFIARASLLQMVCEVVCALLTAGRRLWFPFAVVIALTRGEPMSEKSPSIQSTTGHTLAPSWPMKAPFPWFGGKSRVAAFVWERLGCPDHYIEPFAGSLAVLLSRPSIPRSETINDADGYVTNFWRAVRRSPLEVARLIDGPALEPDLWARRKALVSRREEFTKRLCAEPDFFDPVIAAWWVWTINASISPQLKLEEGKPGTQRGIFSSSYALGDLIRWFEWLSQRLGKVRVLCGDWSRAVAPGELNSSAGTTAVFLDPPYAPQDGRKTYSVEVQHTAVAVREWALSHGSRRRLRIALCGHENEHEMPSDWTAWTWKRQGGFANQKRGEQPKDGRETIWFSPACNR